MNRARTGAHSKPILPEERRNTAKITPNDVKLCELCGTLNLASNKECWTCCWHGGFSREEQTIDLAWKRLESLYEEVRTEHVTARRTHKIGDFGAARPVSLIRRISAKINAGWQSFLNGRDLRMAQRQARLRTRMPSPPDQLSI